MATIQQIVESLERLHPEDLEAVAAFVAGLAETREKDLQAKAEAATNRLIGAPDDPPATGVWKKPKNITHTDDW